MTFIRNVLRVILCEQTHLSFVEVNCSDKGSWCCFGLIDRVGGVKDYLYSVNMVQLHPDVSHMYEILNDKLGFVIRLKVKFWAPQICEG